MFSAYVRNMNNQNKLNLTLSGKTVMENISLSLKTKKKGHYIPTLNKTAGDTIIFDDDVCKAEIKVISDKTSLTLFFSALLKDDGSTLPDSFDPLCSAMIEFSAPQVNISLAKNMAGGYPSPSFCNFNTMPENTADVISRCDKGFIRYMPQMGDVFSTRLRGLGTHATLIMSTARAGYRRLSGEVLRLNYSTDAYSLMQKGEKAVTPPFNFGDRVGFYGHTLNQEGILRRLELLKSRGVTAKILVIDLFKNPVVEKLEADGNRFPNGLRAFISDIKKQTGLQHIGVRYPLGIGIRGFSEMGEGLLKTAGGFVLPRAEEKIYDKLNRYLADAGVSFAVIGEQEHLFGCLDGETASAEARRKYFEVANKSAKKHFGGVLYSGAFLSSIKPHIVSNGYLASFDGINYEHILGSVAFNGKQSAIYFAGSGAPLLLADLPDGDLQSLVTHTGSVLRCDSYHKVCRRNLLSDPTTDGKILRLFNMCNGSGVISAFNVSEKGETVRGDVCADDVEGLEGNKFICRLLKENKFMVCGRDTRIPLSLSKQDAELIIFTPIVDGFAFIGNTEKLLSPATFKKQGEEYHLSDLGQVALYSERGFEDNCGFVRQGNIFVAKPTHPTVKIKFEN